MYRRGWRAPWLALAMAAFAAFIAYGGGRRELFISAALFALALALLLVGLAVLLRLAPGALTWADLGAGAGFPGLVLAILHDNLHLERMADYCVTIAKLTKLVRDVPHDTTLIEGFEEMGARAEEMIRVALDSFSARNLEQAETLVDLDELIDRANRRVVNHQLELGTEPERREWGLRMILVSRCLERIGDHAVDIGEQTAYLVTGEFREFTDASH